MGVYARCSFKISNRQLHSDRNIPAMMANSFPTQPHARQGTRGEQLGKNQSTRILAQSETRTNTTACGADSVYRRTRKSHKKVRTGCQTCKIRHKKCDETRPACKRCTTTGRQCDGYGHDTRQADVQVPLHRSNFSTSETTTIAEEVYDHPHSLAKSPCVVFHESGSNNFNIGNSLPVQSELNPLHTDWSIPISEALQDVEIEAFISGFGTIDEEHRSDICTPVHEQASQNTNSIPRALNIFSNCIQTSDLEIHCFSQFRFRTGPQFASYFDSTFWRQYCTSFALCHPVLFAAATALGAVHRRYGYGISREAFEYCAHASRLKLKAQRMLHKLKAEQGDTSLNKTSAFNTGFAVNDRDVIMASELLLGLYEGFQSNFDIALSHMKSGLKYMLDRPMRLIYSETTYGPTESPLSGFVAFVERIKDSASEAFDSPVCILATRASDEVMPPLPEVFADLDEARDYIFTEAEWILSTPLSVWHHDGEWKAAQNLHINRILRWSVAYANTIVNIERTSRQKRACMLCKLLRTALYFLLYLAVYVSKDIDFNQDTSNFQTMSAQLAFAQTALWEAVATRDEILSNLARIQILGDSIIDDKHVFHYVEHSVDFDSAMGPPQTGKQLVESSGKTRHLVKMLSGKPIDDVSLWETLGVYGVAEKISAIEEHAVIGAVRLLIPPEISPKWVDVACIMEERKILLRYCHQDVTGTVIWTQQWWTFS